MQWYKMVSNWWKFDLGTRTLQADVFFQNPMGHMFPVGLSLDESQFSLFITWLVQESKQYGVEQES